MHSKHIVASLTGALLLLCSNAVLIAAEHSYKASFTVELGCEVRLDIEKPPGVYTIVFRGDNYPLKRVSPNARISATELRIAGDVLLLMAEPAFNRARVAIARFENNEQKLLPIDYDDELLSAQLNKCLEETDEPLLSRPIPGSPFALRPTPAQLREQAKTLGIELDDFYACPCGQAFASTKMRSPPWHYDQLLLIRSKNQCTLQSDEPNHPELLNAGSLDNKQFMDCRALVGIRTENQLVNHQFKNKPEYSQSQLQACYNIIGAKARQWLASGGDIKLVDDNEASSAQKITQTEAQLLSCTAH